MVTYARVSSSSFQTKADYGVAECKRKQAGDSGHCPVGSLAVTAFEDRRCRFRLAALVKKAKVFLMKISDEKQTNK